MTKGANESATKNGKNDSKKENMSVLRTSVCAVCLQTWQQTVDVSCLSGEPTLENDVGWKPGTGNAAAGKLEACNPCRVFNVTKSANESAT